MTMNYRLSYINILLTETMFMTYIYFQSRKIKIQKKKTVLDVPFSHKKYYPTHIIEYIGFGTNFDHH